MSGGQKSDLRSVGFYSLSYSDDNVVTKPRPLKFINNHETSLSFERKNTSTGINDLGVRTLKKGKIAQ